MLGQALFLLPGHALGVGIQLQAALAPAGAERTVEADAGMAQLPPKPRAPA